ncbi:hypothetical protein, partial [Klebsiella michiganensis]|uniref:hypothetical protein n=1 Tax=Klebsiella michiganensis TaxID=1134687 RepID=UPI0013D40222
AIVAAAEAAKLALPAVESFSSITGYGVRAEVAGARIEIGADRHMALLGLDPAVFAKTARRLGDEGKT